MSVSKEAIERVLGSNMRETRRFKTHEKLLAVWIIRRIKEGFEEEMNTQLTIEPSIKSSETRN